MGMTRNNLRIQLPGRHVVSPVPVVGVRILSCNHFMVERETLTLTSRPLMARTQGKVKFSIVFIMPLTYVIRMLSTSVRPTAEWPSRVWSSGKSYPESTAPIPLLPRTGSCYLIRFQETWNHDPPPSQIWAISPGKSDLWDAPRDGNINLHIEPSIIHCNYYLICLYFFFAVVTA